MNKAAVAIATIAALAAAGAGTYYKLRSDCVQEAEADLQTFSKAVKTLASEMGSASAYGLTPPSPEIVLRRGEPGNGVYALVADTKKKDSKTLVFNVSTKFGPILGDKLGKYRSKIQLVGVENGGKDGRLPSDLPIVFDLSKSMDRNFDVAMRPFDFNRKSGPGKEDGSYRVKLERAEGSFDEKLSRYSLRIAIPEISARMENSAAERFEIKNLKIESNERRVEGDIFAGPATLSIDSLSIADGDIVDVKKFEYKQNAETQDGLLNVNSAFSVGSTNIGNDRGSLKGEINLLRLKPSVLSQLEKPAVNSAKFDALLPELMGPKPELQLNNLEWKTPVGVSTAQAYISGYADENSKKIGLHKAGLSVKFSWKQIEASVVGRTYEDWSREMKGRIDRLAQSGALKALGDDVYAFTIKAGKTISPSGDVIELNGKRMTLEQARELFQGADAGQEPDVSPSPSAAPAEGLNAAPSPEPAESLGKDAPKP